MISERTKPVLISNPGDFNQRAIGSGVRVAATRCHTCVLWVDLLVGALFFDFDTILRYKAVKYFCFVNSYAPPDYSNSWLRHSPVMITSILCFCGLSEDGDRWYLSSSSQRSQAQNHDLVWNRKWTKKLTKVEIITTYEFHFCHAKRTENTGSYVGPYILSLTSPQPNRMTGKFQDTKILKSLKNFHCCRSRPSSILALSFP